MFMWEIHRQVTFLVSLLFFQRTVKSYRQQIEVEGYIGAQVLADTMQLQSRDVQSKCIYLCFTSSYRLPFLSCQDGSTLIGQLNPEATSIIKVSSILEGDQDD